MTRHASAPAARDQDWMEDRIRELIREEMRGVPIRQKSKSPTVISLVVGRGQTLYAGATTIYGVNAIAGNWTASLPAAAPTPGTTYTDGLGYAYPIDSAGVVSATPVWFLNSYGNLNGVATGSGVIYPLAEGSRVFVASVAAQPYTGGGGLTAPLYLAWRS